jgi:hypothetical protein
MSRGMPKTGEKIILTDWPKVKHIEANYRGVETEYLVKIHKDMFHLMMTFHAETAGGYGIEYGYKEVAAELNFRKAVPTGYEHGQYDNA